MKKKIKLHILNNESGHTKMEVGRGKILLWSLFIITSIAGFFWMIWSPNVVERVFEQPMLKALRSENHNLRTSLKEVNEKKGVLDTAVNDLKASFLRVTSLSGVAVPTSMKKSKHRSSNELLEEVLSVHAKMDSAMVLFEKSPEKVLALPVIYPVKNRRFISADYGMKMDAFTGQTLPHLGIDFPGETGDSVMATGHGKISEVRRSKIYGLVIKVNHGWGIYTRYTHLDKALVRLGQSVKRGESIALLGASGRSSGPHLHYEVLYKDKHLDPNRFLLPDR